MNRAERLIRAGEQLLDTRHLAQAAGCFEEAVAAVIGSGGKPSPQLLSSWGYTMALGKHEYARGLAICRRAAEKAPSDAELLSRVGSIHLACGDRQRAYQAFSLGLRQNPRHPGIRERLASLGIRRRPPLPFLSRRHLVNRTLGRLRARYPSLFSRP